MNVVAVFIVLAVIAVVAAVVSGVVRGDLAEPTSSLPPAGVPDGDLLPEDLQAVRFSLGFRGYRMDEVDEVLDRVAVELVRRDAEIERLSGLLGRAAATARASGGVAGGAHDDVPQHHGRHVRPEQAADDHAVDEHAVDEHAVDEHAVDEHAVDEHAVDDHRADQERPRQHGSNGAAPASVVPAAGRRPGWPGPDGT